MAEIVRLPLMTDTMEEGVIASWLYQVGEPLPTGEAVAEVETDKATMELENYEEGVLLHRVEEGSAVPINGPIFIVGEPGEDISALLAEFNGGAPAAPDATPKEPVSAPEPAAEAPATAATTAPVDLSTVKATALRMPLMTDTMTEGVIASWLVNVGDTVASGDILAEVETDKATMELECYEDGTLLYLAVEEGNGVPIDGIFAIVGEPGADYQKILDAEKNKGAAESTPAETPAATPAPENTSSAAQTPAPTAASTTTPEGRLKASPLARKMAEEKGYVLAEIKGTGENGRIIKRDVEAHTPAPVAAPQSAQKQEAAQPAANTGGGFAQEGYRDEKVSQMRKAIGRRLSESKFTAPHFYLTVSINMDKAIEVRKRLNEVAPVKLSFNDLVIKAVAASLRQHPKVNASWQGDTIRYYDHVHIGVAVAVDEGLLVPVVRFADVKSLSQINGEVKDFAQRAKDKKLQPHEWEGNTFTISNLGMFGIDEFTAIVNPPDACILAVGGINQVPVVKDGEIVPGNVMKVTLSCDHRVVDGAIGAPFLKTLKEYLEDPIRLMV